MSRSALLLGIDLGTTGCKALLIDERGAVVAEATRAYPLRAPLPHWSEQDPTEWWNSAAASIRAIVERADAGERIAAVGLTGQMHGLVLLDASGEVLRPAILWNDQRTAAQCERLSREIGLARLLGWTGNALLPGFTAPKIVWVREHEPEVYARVAHVLLPKDYLRYRLTGEYLGDVSDASGTSLFDVGRRRWSDEMLAATAIPRAWLPEVTESPVASARVSPSAARETGLLDGTPIVAGAGDQAAQAVGGGLVAAGEVSVTIGTSGVVFAASPSYAPEPAGRLHAFCHAVPGMWHYMGVMLSAGGSLRWYRDVLGESERAAAAATGGDPYDVLLEDAARAPAGCDGLIFLPYLSGERTPHVDPHARGVFFGLSSRHEKPHLTRALVEGITFGLRDSLELLRNLGVASPQVRVSGGGARSALWRQIVADIFGMPVVTSNVTQGAAFGAALLAGVGAGVYPDVATAAGRVVRFTSQADPGPAVSVYQALYPRYRALYQALAAEFRSVAALGPEQC